MKLVKSLLLGSAALVAAAAGAQAADLPFRKAAPVDYVRVCDWTGTGYFYIPGTDTCLKIGGFVYAEYAYVTGGKSVTPTPTGPNGPNFVTTPSRSRAQSGFFLRGQIDADARTQTAYGTLRTYVRYRMDRYSGTYNAGFGTGAGLNSTVSRSNPYLDKGFIQFAGITAGRVQSFFDFYADNYNFDGIANSDQSNQVLAYTANFAGGFSATISMEDRDTRNTGIGNVAFGNTGMPNMVGANAIYAGQTIPDFVGSLNVDQAWGRAQLSGAFHDVNTVAVLGGPNGLATSRDTEGWALNAGLMVKLPMLAAGDELWLEGGYMNGAISYQDSGQSNTMNGGFYGELVPGFQHVDEDAIAVANPNGNGGYHLYTPTGFHVLAGLKHYWTPQFHTFTFGSYEEISYGNVVKNIDWTRGGIGDASEFRVGNQFIFTPVNNLDIGVEVMYARIDQTLAHERGQLATALPVGVAKNGDVFTTRLKLERDF